ncbi:hypothetical protein P7B02_02565 [Caulobacter segnis]|uniref:hypothetical protein n=1 Tax=Caulobacter segnis TaxID=88688 RepID=UPI00240FAB56|nr:hypothetical protein [Caulobacter segnis]MDG2520410.1 hypothetical protein [Caulobacter segnis]
MSIARRIVGWLGGTAALYIVLVLAILAGGFVAPWIKSQWRDPAHQLALADRIEQQVIAPLARERDEAQNRLERMGVEARAQSLDQLDRSIARARSARNTETDARRGGAAKALSLARGDAGALLEDGRRELRINALDAEITGLTAARERIVKGELVNARGLDVAAARATADEARTACRAARLAFEAASGRWSVKASLGIYDRRNVEALRSAMQTRCDASRAADRRQLDAQRIQDVAARSYTAAQTWTNVRIAPVTGDAEAWIAERRLEAQGTLGQKLSLWAERVHLNAALWKAGVALALIIASPFLIRLFCYFVLAPLAMRRPQIRVLDGVSEGATIRPAERSSASVSVRLSEGEELLVRHGYLQTTSDAGPKSTQWLLDSRHPITSLASGLVFLTRVRGEDQVTTVSATRDPFSEVTILDLPQDGACVLQPRALAAVAQPIGRRLKITSHWRLFSLNAWLTLQLRFLVFHGPARLVLQGGRGVRVERAEHGRILGQDQVVGFSTDLAYSVTRTETFWPYVLGREPLLKDRVAAGQGVVIIEEAPLSRLRGGHRPRGIEGGLDALMKVFGL